MTRDLVDISASDVLLNSSIMQGSVLIDQTCADVTLHTRNLSQCAGVSVANTDLHHWAPLWGSAAGIKWYLKMPADFKARLFSDEFQCCYNLTVKKALSFICHSCSEHQCIILLCFTAGTAFLRSLTLTLVLFILKPFLAALLERGRQHFLYWSGIFVIFTTVKRTFSFL